MKHSASSASTSAYHATMIARKCALKVRIVNSSAESTWPAAWTPAHARVTVQRDVICVSLIFVVQCREPESNEDYIACEEWILV